MKDRNPTSILAWMGLIAILAVILASCKPSVAPSPVRLDITGPEGQRFTGGYIADGLTNLVSAVAPASIRFQAKEASYQFSREGGIGEFRVALYVGDICRSSVTSDKRQGVIGGMRASDDSSWANAF